MCVILVVYVIWCKRSVSPHSVTTLKGALSFLDACVKVMSTNLDPHAGAAGPAVEKFASFSAREEPLQNYGAL